MEESPLTATIGPYTVLGRLGQGDFADVYRVVLTPSEPDDPPEPELALKIARSMGGDADRRLEVEIDALTRLRHDSIPAHTDDGRHEGRRFVVMTLAPGKSLRAVWEANVQNNRRMSDVEAMLLARRLLTVLDYLATEAGGGPDGWAHRDIKDANVLVTDSIGSVTLLDFGFFKADGETDARMGDSFFRAGAARYSPLPKLDSPTAARSTHDVFAVGVLLYQMMTNYFPWSAPSGNVDELRTAMRTERPARVSDLNNVVHVEVSRFVESLLVLQDAYRPSAREALSSAVGLLDGPLSRQGSVLPAGRPLKYDRVWRDALYGDIRLTQFEMDVIDTPEMQRLRGFAQLGLTHVVYESARHSRLSHAVGTLHRVEEILSSIERIDGVRIDNEHRQAARLFALVHDVTHVALGHTLEDEYGFFARHDLNEGRIARLVLDPSGSHLAELLLSTDFARVARSHFDASATVLRRSDIPEIVSGPVGADLLDYVDRDSYFCGLSHRVDGALLRQIRLVPYKPADEPHVVSLLGSSYGLRTDREYAVESLYEERYALFLKVYANKTKIKASALVAKALAICLTAAKRPGLAERDIEWMNDEELLRAIATRRPKNERESKLIGQLGRRLLPRAAYRAGLLPDRDDQSLQARLDELSGDGPRGLFPMERRLAVEDALARAAGIKQDDVFVYAARTPPGYKKTQGHKFLVESTGTPKEPTGEWFNRVKRRHMGLWDLWVFITHDATQDQQFRLADAAEAHFGFANQVATPVRQGLLF